MYYRLGSIDKDFDFIYDSSDSSCELVSHKELIESGVVFTDRFYTYDYDKFKLICGSRLGLYDETWNRIKMFEYEVSLGCNLNADIAIEMLDYMLRLVKCHDIFALSKMFDGYLLYKLVLKDIVNDIRFRSKGLLEVVDWSL